MKAKAAIAMVLVCVGGVEGSMFSIVVLVE